MNYALTVTNLNKTSGGVKVLSNISFQLEKGSITGIMGLPGCGKTVLMKTLAGLEKVDDEGEIFFDTTNIGYMPQESALYLDMTVQQNIKFFQKTYKGTKENMSIDILLEILLLEEQKDVLLSNLPHSVWKRVSLACLFAGNYDFLLIDELNFSFETGLEERIQEYLKNISKTGVTILYSTSDLFEFHLDQNVLVLHNAMIDAKGKLSSILQKYKVEDINSLFIKLHSTS